MVSVLLNVILPIAGIIILRAMRSRLLVWMERTGR